MLDVIEALRKENSELKSLIDKMRVEHEATVVRLTAEILALKQRMFGPKAEKVKNAASQQALFDTLAELGLLAKGDGDAGERAEELVADLNAEMDSDDDEEDEQGPSRRGQKKSKKNTPHGRRDLDESKLPKEVIELEPVERKLPGGELLVKVGEEVTRHLDYRPSSFVVVEVHRAKYMKPEDTGTPATAREDDAPAPEVFSAPPPSLPIDKGLAGPGLLSLVLVMKYADHLPWHRQERIFGRQGVPFRRSTLCGFVQGCSKLLVHITNSMWLDGKTNSPLLLTDACGVLVQEPERCRRGHFQVFIAPERHVFFSYLPKNNGDVVADLLVGFKGKLQSDASSVYHETFRREPSILEVGCWAHARRGFFKALPTDEKRALTGIGLISNLYDADFESRDPTTGAIDGEKRKALATPILNDIAAWLERERALVDSRSLIETALGYCQRQWVPLTRFLDDASLRLDNNLSEGELRHQVVGSKNWLFCATDAGAAWNATVVSLIASCRMHGIEPQAYLRDVLSLLPEWKKSRALELAPMNWKETLKKPETIEHLERVQLIRGKYLAHDVEDPSQQPA